MAGVPAGIVRPHRHSSKRLSEESRRALSALIAERGWKWASIHLHSSVTTLQSAEGSLALKHETIARLEAILRPPPAPR